MRTAFTTVIEKLTVIAQNLSLSSENSVLSMKTIEIRLTNVESELSQCTTKLQGLLNPIKSDHEVRLLTAEESNRSLRLNLDTTKVEELNLMEKQDWLKRKIGKFKETMTGVNLSLERFGEAQSNIDKKLKNIENRLSELEEKVSRYEGEKVARWQYMEEKQNKRWQDTEEKQEKRWQDMEEKQEKRWQDMEEKQEKRWQDMEEKKDKRWQNMVEKQDKSNIKFQNMIENHFIKQSVHFETSSKNFDFMDEMIEKKYFEISYFPYSHITKKDQLWQSARLQKEKFIDRLVNDLVS